MAPGGVNREVQVGAAGVATVADSGDLLASGDVLTDVDQPGVDVPVPGDRAVVTTNVDSLTEATGVAGTGSGDRTRRGGMHRSADRSGKVDALVGTAEIGRASCRERV